MTEREQIIRDKEKYSVAIRRYYKDIRNMLDSFKESFNELFSHFDDCFGKEPKS